MTLDRPPVVVSPIGFTIARLAAVALLALGICAATVRAESIDFSAGKSAVRVTAIRPNIFRVSVNGAGGAVTPRQSVYLDPALKLEDDGKLTASAGHQRLQAEAGVIDIDPANGTLSLLDAHGIVLVPAARVGSVDDASGPPTLALHIGWAADKSFAVYGCGNEENSLLQHKVESVVKNRQTVVPFFWAPAGFATFVVGDHDDAPATCDGKVTDGAVSWRAAGASADLYLIIAPTLGDATHGLLELTGRPPVPPEWTFGYLQSRWGWADKAYVDDTLHQFQSRHLPVDAFIFDFEWYTTLPDYSVPPEGVAGFSDFGVNAKLFPELQGQIKDLHEAGVHFVGIRKPRIGNADTLNMVRGMGWGYSGAPTGTDARGLAFANPSARDWYAKQLEPLLRAGVDGWWNDEGEFSYTTFSHWNEAEIDAQTAVDPKQRFWSINRAFAPGTSRLGATAWTGDIHGSWKDLHNTPTTILNWGLAGMPFTACDIGGYRGNAPADLVVRWMEAGTFLPVMRAHSRRTDTPHFPWLYGPEAESAIRKALELRYRLVPVLYSLAHETHDTGEPMMRPLAMQYPTDPKVANLSDQWLLGQDLLAAPVLEEGGRRKVYLPDDIWYDFTTGKRIDGGRGYDLKVAYDAAPLYLRGGTILPLAPVVQHTSELPGGPLDVNVYPGRNGAFTLVEDDGSTTAYLNGDLRNTAFTWDDKTRSLSWTRTGPYSGKNCFRSLRVTLHGGGDQQPVEQALTPGGRVRL